MYHSFQTQNESKVHKHTQRPNKV